MTISDCTYRTNFGLGDDSEVWTEEKILREIDNNGAVHDSK